MSLCITKIAESGERTDVLGVVRIMHESEDKFVLYSVSRRTRKD